MGSAASYGFLQDDEEPTLLITVSLTPTQSLTHLQEASGQKLAKQEQPFLTESL